jgi:hypothetical protein
MTTVSKPSVRLFRRGGSAQLDLGALAQTAARGPKKLAEVVLAEPDQTITAALGRHRRRDLTLMAATVIFILAATLAGLLMIS